MRNLTFILIALLTFLPDSLLAGNRKLNTYVNPMIGASTDVEIAGAYHGLGKTFPGAATPYGMVQVSPQTITGGDNGSGYSDHMKTIEGFCLTQMSGIGWNGDLGNFTVMPTNGPLQLAMGREDGSQKGYRSAYNKETETARAGYYAVTLTNYNIRTECTATTHCGFMRFTFPENEQSRIQIDLARRVGGTADMEEINIIDDHTFEGWLHCTPDGGGWGDGLGHADYKIFFHATLSKPMKDWALWSADIPEGQSRHLDDVISNEYQKRIADAKVERNARHALGKHIGFFTEFDAVEGEQVVLKVGISYCDVEGARKNYHAEAEGLSFDDAHRLACDSWDKELSRIQIEGGTDDEKIIFYTAMYHTMIDPRIHQDVDGRYVGGDQKVYMSDGTFTKRTIFSGWDVFRSQMPLQTIINPTLVGDLINSLTTLATQSGRRYYERWELMNAYSGCMFGNPALSVIADAYAKNIRNFDAPLALEYCKNSSAEFGNDKYGYTPGGMSISHTLEYAYADWCVGRLAGMLGDKATQREFYKKSQAYRNIWDEQHAWFRPRLEDGSWMEWPEEGRLKEWYGTMECNPLQQGWFVPHDVPGMVKLMGGKNKVLDDLQWMFERTPKDMFWNLYYNHANEPVHGVPYLFNRLDAPWLTQYWTRFICKNAYENKVAGLKGNEDVGQMSAWYVLSAIGLHPYCPGETRTEITSPVFSRITVQLPATGKTFTIVAENNSDENIYIQNMTLNGKPLKRCWLDFSEIVAGGELRLVMGNKSKHKN